MQVSKRAADGDMSGPDLHIDYIDVGEADAADEMVMGRQRKRPKWPNRPYFAKRMMRRMDTAVEDDKPEDVEKEEGNATVQEGAAAKEKEDNMVECSQNIIVQS